MGTWQESEHPRDDDGKFTFKNGGASSGGSNSSSLSREDILYPTMKNKEPNYDDNFKGLGNYNNENLSREDILYPTMRDKESNYDFFFKGLGNYGNMDIQRESINKKDEGILTGGAASIIMNNDDYIENLKETNPVKKYENNTINEFKQNLREKSIEIAPRWNSSYNAKFSDEELKRARKFIQGIEKFEPKAYFPTSNDKLTIGYGHTGLVDGKPITLGMEITEEKAEELYRKDFEIHTAPLKDVQVPLTNNQKIALASFLYNLGPNILKGSDMLKKINKGDYEGAANEFDNYIHQKGKVLKGLINRRKREKELFLTPDS